MDADYTGKQVSVTTTNGAQYRGILQSLDISNGTITMNNITTLTPPYTAYQPGYALSFAGNDLSELNFIEEAAQEEEEEEEESEEEEEEEQDDFMKQQEHFQKELEAMRSKSKKEAPSEPKKSSFFDSFDDEEEYSKTKYNAAKARKTNYDTFGESGAVRRGTSRGNSRGRGGYKGKQPQNSKPRGGDQQADLLKTPMF